MFFLNLLPPRTRRILLLELFAAAAAGLFTGGTLPFLGVIARKDLHASPLLISLIAAAPYFGLLTSPFWAACAQGRRRVATLVVAALAFRLVMLPIHFTSTAGAFVLVAAASLLVSSFGAPVYVALLKEFYPDDLRGRATSLVRTVATFSAMLAAALVGGLLGKWSFHVVLPAVALLSAPGVLLFAFIPEPRPGATVSPSLAGPAKAFPTGLLAPVKAGLALLREDRIFAKFSLVFFIFGTANLTYLPVIPVFQVDELHITTAWVGMLATVGALSAGLSFYLWGKVMDRHGPVASAPAVMLLWSLTAAAYALAPNLPALLPIAIVSGISGAGTELVLPNAVIQFAERDRIPLYSGVQYSLLGARGVFAPFLGGLLLGPLHARVIFALCSGVILFAFLLALRVSREMKAHENPAH